MTNGWIPGCPAIADGKVYIGEGMANNKFYCFREEPDLTPATPEEETPSGLFAVNVVQIRHDGDSYSSAGGDNLKLAASYIEKYNRELLTLTYDIKLQIYGESVG